MNHNDVARRTAHTLPARSLTPRTLGLQEGPTLPDPTVRTLERPLRARSLTRICEGGR